MAINIFGPNEYDFESIYKNILLLDHEQFEYIIYKYSNFDLSTYSIQLDPKINTKIIPGPFNLADKLLDHIIMKKKTIDQSKLELILKNIKLKSNSHLLNLFETIKGYELLKNLKNMYDSFDITDSIILKTYVNVEELKSQNKKSHEYLYLFLMIKLLIMFNIYNDFSKILTNLYCCSGSTRLKILDMIMVLKPELINLDLTQLKKIIVYGRLKVFDFLFLNVPWLILNLLKDSDPFDLSDIELDYTDDIYSGSFYYEKELERTIIGCEDFQHEKLINAIMTIGLEKNYQHIQWTDKTRIYWLKLALEYAIDNTTLSKEYFIQYDKLLEIYNLVVDFTNKESIYKHIQLVGKKETWDLIKIKCDESILDLI